MILKNNMFLIRISFVLVAFVSMSWSEEAGEDRIGTILSMMADIKTQIAQLETKVDKVDNDVALSWLPWKFIGHGYWGSLSHFVIKEHTTLQECVAFCTKKRLDSGTKWNGFHWYLPNDGCSCTENDVGHTEDADHLHFKI